MLVEIRNKYTNSMQLQFELEIGLGCVFVTKISKINPNFLREQNIDKFFIEHELIQWIENRNIYKENILSDIQILKILGFEDKRNHFGRMYEYSYIAMLLTYFDIGDEYIITPVFDELVCFYYLNPYLYKIYHLEVFNNDIDAQKYSCS